MLREGESCFGRGPLDSGVYELQRCSVQGRILDITQVSGYLEFRVPGI